MGVEVLSKVRHALSQHVSGSSLAGDGLLVRIRSTSIAMLAAVTAIGLGLVVFISQQGWPEVFSGPIPANPEAAVVHNDTIAPPPAGGGFGGVAVTPRGGVPSNPSSAPPRGARGVGAGSALAGSRQISSQGPAAHAAPIASEPPAATPAPSPAPTAPVQTPVATPAPAPAPTAPVADTDTDGGAQSAASSPLGEIARGAVSEDDDGSRYHGGWYHHSPPPPPLAGLANGGSKGHSHSQQPKESLPPASEYPVPAPAQIPALPNEASSEGGGGSGYRGVGKPGWGRH